MSTTVSPVAIVTGASRGLGAAVCEALLKSGYSVAAASRRPSPETERLTDIHPHRYRWAALDLAADESRNWVAEMTARFGGIDVLVNNAGQLHTELFLTQTVGSINDTLGVNLVGPLLLSQAVARQMDRRGGGVIVNVSSINAVRGHRGVASYSAAKAGLDGLTRALARELGPVGIRVNSIVPGFFESAMTYSVSADNVTRIARRTPLGRLGTIDDVVSAVEFLVSPSAGFITGQTIVIDGGLTC